MLVTDINSEDFPEEWRSLLEKQSQMAERAGIKNNKDLFDVCGVSMFSHWFTTSQFNLISEKQYKKLSEKFPEAFDIPWQELKTEWDEIKHVYSHSISRAYFDNTCDGKESSLDIWEFKTPSGEERPDHPTPKSLPMMQRIERMCCPEGGVILEPFGGSGQTLIAAENTGRRAYLMEITPKFCDLIIQRWQNLTGEKAYRELDGVLFDDLTH